VGVGRGRSWAGCWEAVGHTGPDAHVHPAVLFVCACRTVAQLEFGAVSVGIPSDQVATVKNVGSVAAVFWINPSDPSIKASPDKGCILGGACARESGRKKACRAPCMHRASNGAPVLFPPVGGYTGMDHVRVLFVPPPHPVGESLDVVVTLKCLEPKVFDDKTSFVTLNLRGAKPLLLPFSAEVVLPDVSIVEEACVAARAHAHTYRPHDTQQSCCPPPNPPPTHLPHSPWAPVSLVCTLVHSRAPWCDLLCAPPVPSYHPPVPVPVVVCPCVGCVLLQVCVWRRDHRRQHALAAVVPEQRADPRGAARGPVQAPAVHAHGVCGRRGGRGGGGRGRRRGRGCSR
jgi:hypothetical protein